MIEQWQQVTPVGFDEDLSVHHLSVHAKRCDTQTRKAAPNVHSLTTLYGCIKHATFRVLLANLSEHPCPTYRAAIRQFKGALVGEQPR